MNLKERIKNEMVVDGDSFKLAREICDENELKKGKTFDDIYKRIIEEKRIERRLHERK